MLLSNTAYSAVHGKSKLVETPTHFRNSCFDSKPSSVTTACTHFTSDYSSFKNEASTSTKKTTQKKEQKPKQAKNLVGSKRAPEVETSKPLIPFLIIIRQIGVLFQARFQER
jgi:hypothetical protein